MTDRITYERARDLVYKSVKFPEHREAAVELLMFINQQEAGVRRASRECERRGRASPRGRLRAREGGAVKQTITIKTEATVELDLDMLATLFAELDDDSQAQFFVKVAAKLDAMPTTQWASDVARWQAEHIGRHLATCSCSTGSARIFIGNIYDAMTEARKQDADP